MADHEYISGGSPAERMMHSDEFSRLRGLSAQQLAELDWRHFELMVRPLLLLPYMAHGAAKIVAAPGGAGSMVEPWNLVQFGDGSKCAEDFLYHTPSLLFHTVPSQLARNRKPNPRITCLEPCAELLANARCAEGQGSVPWHLVASPEGLYLYRTADGRFETDPLIRASYDYHSCLWARVPEQAGPPKGGRPSPRTAPAETAPAEKKLDRLLREQALCQRKLVREINSQFRARYARDGKKMTPLSATDTIRGLGFDITLKPWSCAPQDM
jgi:hypothetical protein